MQRYVLTFLLLAAGLLSALPASAEPPSPIWGCNETNRMLFYNLPMLEGSDVYDLQLRLKQLGYYCGPLHSIFDAQTEQAVLAFQTAHRLKIDGQVGPNTWKAMDKGVVQVNTQKGPPPGKIEIVINLDKRTLTILSDGKPYYTYPVGIGEEETPSPVGEWRIIHKSSGWGGGFGTRWLGLNVPWGIYGIHGTNKPWSVGNSASHGCLRMLNRDVEEFYPWVQVGTRVRIEGKALFFPWYERRTIRPGATGQDVVLVQVRLQDLGLYWGWADGRYGEITMMAVKYFQLLNGLPGDGNINAQTYKALGF